LYRDENNAERVKDYKKLEVIWANELRISNKVEDTIRHITAIDTELAKRENERGID